MKSSEFVSCTLKLTIEIDEEIARYVMKAIGVEFSSEGEIEQRTELKMEYDGKALCFTINSKDLSSLRAAVNSYLRWLNLAIEGATMLSN